MQLLEAPHLFNWPGPHLRQHYFTSAASCRSPCAVRMSSTRRGKRQQAIEEHLTPDAADTKPKKQAVEKDDAPAEKTRKRGKQPTTAEVDTARATVEGTAKPEAGGAGSADAVAQKSSKGKGSKKVNTHDEQADKDQTHKKAKTEPRAGTSAGGAVNLPENTMEQGRVFFMYKPRVTSPGEEPSVSGLNDIQRTYLLLQPEQPTGGKSRLLVLPKKKLPDPGRHERFFAFVEAVADRPSELTSGLTEEHYTTKTRGERVQPAARAVGEGPYVIAKGGKRGGVHWGYKLEVPQEPGEAQKVLGIRPEGSYVLSAKNPDQKGRPGVPSAGPEPEYSTEQREQFSNRSWIGVEDPSLLDVPGTELLLVGATADPIETGELGDAGDLLQQLSDEEEDILQKPEQQEQLLKEALEPTAAKEVPIPVEPALTGDLE